MKEELQEKSARQKKLLDRDLEEIAKLPQDEQEKINKLWITYTDQRKKFEKDYNIFSGMTTDFQQQLSLLLKEKNKSALEIAEEVGISPKTLSSYRQGHNAPSMQTLIAICMALELDVKQATILLTSLGLCFLGTSREHYAYMYLLENCRGKSIDECNEILTGLYIGKRYQLYPRKKKEQE